MKSGPILLFLMILLLVLVGVFYQYHYSNIQEPLIEDGKTTLTELKDIKNVGGLIIPTKATLSSTKIISNPNNFPLQIDNILYEYYINDNFIESGEIPQTYLIPANGERNIPVNIELDFTSAIGLIKSGLDSENKTIRITTYTDVYASAPLRKKVISQKLSEKEIRYDIGKYLPDVTSIPEDIITEIAKAGMQEIQKAQETVENVTDSGLTRMKEITNKSLNTVLDTTKTMLNQTIPLVFK